MREPSGEDIVGDIVIRDWLASREPSPPQELADVLAGVVGDRKVADIANLPAALLTIAEGLLVGLSDERHSARNLLASDALITYALEAAADDCASIDEFAGRAMLSIPRFVATVGK